MSGYYLQNVVVCAGNKLKIWMKFAFYSSKVSGDI
jgi:hypothetical protein